MAYEKHWYVSGLKQLYKAGVSSKEVFQALYNCELSYKDLYTINMQSGVKLEYIEKQNIERLLESAKGRKSKKQKHKNKGAIKIDDVDLQDSHTEDFFDSNTDNVEEVPKLRDSSQEYIVCPVLYDYQDINVGEILDSVNSNKFGGLFCLKSSGDSLKDEKVIAKYRHFKSTDEVLPTLGNVNNNAIVYMPPLINEEN